MNAPYFGGLNQFEDFRMTMKIKAFSMISKITIDKIIIISMNVFNVVGKISLSVDKGF